MLCSLIWWEQQLLPLLPYFSCCFSFVYSLCTFLPRKVTKLIRCSYTLKKKKKEGTILALQRSRLEKDDDDICFVPNLTAIKSIAGQFWQQWLLHMWHIPISDKRPPPIRNVYCIARTQ
mmetsp:Transcript_31819/g.46385  ORF Transcript_31819/g.46385 Transcript_31819/m.46385 type:complete len:119 (+) Transcript_31819:943-1299(+)